MRVFATVLICSTGLLLSSCAGLLWPGEDVPKPLPVTPPLTGEAAEASSEPAVAEAPPVVKLDAPRKAPPLLMPMDASTGRLSREYIPPAKTGPAYRTLADGAFTGLQTGWIEPAGEGAWRFVFQSEGGEAEPLEPLKILPNAYLEQMEKIVDERDGTKVIFHVSGEVTRYRRTGYLMIGRAVVEAAPQTDE